jgi:hypothetical protein
MNQTLRMVSIIPIASCTLGMLCFKISQEIRGSRTNKRTQSNLNTMSYHRHFFVDTSNFYRQLLDKDQNIHCMICCDANAGSASWMMMVTEEGDNHIPVELCATLLPGLLVLFFVSHCEYFLWDMFRVIELMVCCHEGRDSKAEEVCAFRQTLPILASFSRHQSRDIF